MAKIITQENETPAPFIDRTRDSWYQAEGSNKIMFARSIKEIIDGKAETHDFTKMETSVLYDKNPKGENIERNYFVLFTLSDNTKTLVRLRDKMK
jgi:hypothetical protein